MSAIDRARWLLENVTAKAQARDDEAAHSEEDALHMHALARISEPDCTIEEARELAVIALSTKDLDFCRWCA